MQSMNYSGRRGGERGGKGGAHRADRGVLYAEPGPPPAQATFRSHFSPSQAQIAVGQRTNTAQAVQTRDTRDNRGAQRPGPLSAPENEASALPQARQAPGWDEEVSRLLSTLETAGAGRLDKINLRQNMQDESIAKIQDRLCAVTADIESLHKVNGGSFGGKFEGLEARLSQFEGSVADMSRDFHAHSKESAREAAAHVSRLGALLSALEDRIAPLEGSIRGASPNGREVAELREVRCEAQDARALAQSAFERSVVVKARVLLSVTVQLTEGDAATPSKLNTVALVSGEIVELRYPMTKAQDDEGSIYMDMIRVDAAGDVTSYQVPVYAGGKPIVAFL
jgi:hypothetical protein